MGFPPPRVDAEIVPRMREVSGEVADLKNDSTTQFRHPVGRKCHNTLRDPVLLRSGSSAARGHSLFHRGRDFRDHVPLLLSSDREFGRFGRLCSQPGGRFVTQSPLRKPDCSPGDRSRVRQNYRQCDPANSKAVRAANAKGPSVRVLLRRSGRLFGRRLRGLNFLQVIRH
jgi:hypothetical protein